MRIRLDADVTCPRCQSSGEVVFGIKDAAKLLDTVRRAGVLPMCRKCGKRGTLVDFLRILPSTITPAV